MPDWYKWTLGVILAASFIGLAFIAHHRGAEIRVVVPLDLGSCERMEPMSFDDYSAEYGGPPSQSCSAPDRDLCAPCFRFDGAYIVPNCWGTNDNR